MSTSERKKRIEEGLEKAGDILEQKAIESYDKALDRLQYEKDRLERELRHEYRNARRYVRANPEQGLGVAFVAGLFLGVLLTRGGKD
ncbi:MAG TPA: hypothetical protein DF712_11820 [Balneola sp.]|jgi:ElaB/YqjD/DUF883 family membrane-anchored ribosome-binding protein|nr:hypothetical protein [Bacteroidota bacterium]MAC05088.1 hypothetical protein [Balneola sp.]MAO77674.1 hypothetical protein [Balneola sp.]MBF63988.1 hypothetical protein [Balneola sp.]HAH51827.1 hypothetical protein [Balneola sp.]|tara:strand:- start:5730 stop:5990 length:261 start_codon:yes stop_codon:yes gene_type:complete